MLSQLLTNQNNEDDSDNHDREEEKTTSNDNNSKESSSINVEVIKGIQAQIASLVGMTRPYPLEWDSVLYPSKFNPPTLHSYDGKSSPN